MLVSVNKERLISWYILFIYSKMHGADNIKTVVVCLNNPQLFLCEEENRAVTKSLSLTSCMLYVQFMKYKSHVRLTLFRKAY
jgi:hypothetical protein